METYTYTMETGAVFETPEHFLFENESLDNSWMDIDFNPDSCSSSMSLFQGLEEIQEVEDAKNSTSNVLLSDLISQCGIPVDEESTNYPPSPASSLDSDMEAHQSLIEELEDFFGSPTVIEEDDESRCLDLITKTSVVTKPNPESILDALSTGKVFNTAHEYIQLSEESLKGAHTTSCMTEDGQNVIIIIAPPSPAPSTSSNYDTDPEWVPSPTPSPLRTLSPSSTTIKKKYQRSKPPTPPIGPYPVEKKERKKAQNRTAAFRYREKKKDEQDVVENELEELNIKNTGLREKLTEMETEAKLLKKLMIEAGLGRYAATIKL